MKRSLFLIFFVFLLLPGRLMLAQVQEDKNSYPPKVNKLFREAIQLQRKGKTKKAIRTYNKILKRAPKHIGSHMRLASIYYYKNEFLKAETSLENAFESDGPINAELYYSMALVKEKLTKRSDAIVNYLMFLESSSGDDLRTKKVTKKVEDLTFQIEAILNPVPFVPSDPGSGINTQSLEYLASLDLDGSKMVFTRRINGQEDLFISKWSDNNWGLSLPIDELNTAENEGAHCLSPDGKTLVFTRCDRMEGFGSCDLFISHFINGGWSEAKNMGDRINSRHWESQPSLSIDGNNLYFSSDRSGGFGGKDIWLSSNINGVWSVPKNIGPKINTKYHDESPFIHPNDLSLYFTSDGHPGMGGRDLFVIHKKGDEWMEVKNLGYPINTDKDDGGLRVASDGITAYFSTDRMKMDKQIKADLDIIQFDLQGENKAIPVLYLNGKVVDKFTRESLQVQVEVYDNFSGSKIAEILSDLDGSFLFNLPQGFSYNFTVNDSSYIYFSENVLIDTILEETETIDLLFEMTPIEKINDNVTVGEAIILNNIFYETASADLKLNESRIELEKLSDFLRSNPSIRVQINGHTDDVGSEEDNMTLSEKRAKNVFDYLVYTGIKKERLDYKGFGENEPLVENLTEKERSINRRTEFEILGN